MERLTLIFEDKGNFSKFRIEPIMLEFLATTENTRKSQKEDSSDNCGKIARKHDSKTAIRNFNRTMGC